MHKENSPQFVFSVLYRSVTGRKQKNNQLINQSYHLNNFVTLRNIQHTSGNRSLKGPALRSADKYTTLLPLAWPINPVFHLRIFFVRSDFLLYSHWLATFFEVKKVGSNPTFYCFRTKKVASYEKICKGKTSFNIKYVNKNFVNFIEISTASCM